MLFSHKGRFAAAKRKHSSKLATRWRTPRIEHLEPRLAPSGISAAPALKATAAGATLNLTPTADTYVFGSSPYSNYGNVNFLGVQNDSSSYSTDDAESYLRFNTASLGSTQIAKAVLTLTPIALGRNYGNLTLGVEMLQAGNDTSWVQGSGGTNYATTGPATWYNTPNGAGTVATAAGSQFSVGTPISIDVTALVNQDINTPDTESFILGAVSWYGRNQTVEFASTSYATAGYWPMLTIMTAGPVVPPPTVAAQPSDSNVTSTSAQLAVLGSDSSAGANLVYTWSVIASPSGAPAPTFGSNGAGASDNTTVTFHQAGSYTFDATITNTTDGQSTVSNPLTVAIAQKLSGIAVTPATTTVAVATTQQFTASGIDQFGQTYNGSIGTVTWTMTGSGAVNSSSGLYTAPATLGLLTTATINAKSSAGTASVTVTLSSSFDGILNPTLSSLTQSLDADGSISRADMIQISRTAETLNGGVISQSILTDLKTLLADGSELNMPGYVEQLASDVINGNPANADYQGKALGNLAVGSTATHLDDLIDKWFLGTDLPNTGGYSYSTINVTASLFATTPSHLQEDQGELGDCYLISSLGTIADSNPAAIENMIIDNGVDPKTGLHTWTVRFYDGSTPEYVTVDNQLPTYGGTLIFDGYGEGTANPTGLWIALIEKAYAQWDETGQEGRDNVNSYTDIQGGWMADVDAQVLGHSAASYNMNSSGLQALIAGMTSHEAVTIGTDTSNNSNDTLSYGLYGSHAYAVVGYNAVNETFTLYNPWGIDQPTQALTWAELQATCDGFVVANASGSQAYATSQVAPRPADGAASAATDNGASANSGDQNSANAAAVDAVLAADAVGGGGETASGNSTSLNQAAVNGNIDAALRALDRIVLVSDASGSEQDAIPAQLRAAAVDSVFASI